MPTNLLLLPILGGYWFVHTFYYTRFRSQRLDGYRLLLESALAGIGLTFLAWLLGKGLSQIPFFRMSWKSLAPAEIPFLGTMIMALLLGFIIPYALNYGLTFAHIIDRRTAQEKAISRYGNFLLQLLHSAQSQEKLVSITLDNGKVYIGVVSGAPNLEPYDTHVAILPFLSGYRNKETQKLTLTVDYLKQYFEHDLDSEDFRVIIPIANIRMASYFDQQLYDAFFVESARQ